MAVTHPWLTVLALALTTGAAACGGNSGEEAPAAAAMHADWISEDDGWGSEEEEEDTWGDEEEGIEDGVHSATVDYYNPETGYSSTYDLDVEVEDGAVTTIYFPRGGWLDDSHIYPEELDEDGRATIIDDQGREFEVEVNP